ncbi:MAG: tetratricopeptide repeat protein [Janthinobacterium lividum]
MNRYLRKFFCYSISFYAIINSNGLANIADDCVNRGVSLSQVGRQEEAIDSFDKVINFNSRNTDAYMHKGLSLGKICRCEDLIESFDRAITLEPRDSSVYKAVILYKEGEHEEAVKCGHFKDSRN